MGLVRLVLRTWEPTKYRKTFLCSDQNFVTHIIVGNKSTWTASFVCYCHKFFLYKVFCLQPLTCNKTILISPPEHTIVKRLWAFNLQKRNRNQFQVQYPQRNEIERKHLIFSIMLKFQRKYFEEFAHNIHTTCVIRWTEALTWRIPLRRVEWPPWLEELVKEKPS